MRLGLAKYKCGLVLGLSLGLNIGLCLCLGLVLSLGQSIGLTKMNNKPWFFLSQIVIFGNNKGNCDIKMWANHQKGLSDCWNKDMHESFCLALQGYGVFQKDYNRSTNC